MGIKHKFLSWATRKNQGSKFEITGEAREVMLRADPDVYKTVYRIKALRDIPKISVSAGDLGGFVENEKNLSHHGNSWIAGDAVAVSGARVVKDGLIKDSAFVAGATVYGTLSGRTIFDGFFAWVKEGAVIEDEYINVIPAGSMRLPYVDASKSQRSYDWKPS